MYVDDDEYIYIYIYIIIILCSQYFTLCALCLNYTAFVKHCRLCVTHSISRIVYLYII